MTTALQAARERLDAWVQALAHPLSPMEALQLRRLEDDLVSAVRFTETPF